MTRRFGFGKERKYFVLLSDAFRSIVKSTMSES